MNIRLHVFCLISPQKKKKAKWWNISVVVSPFNRFTSSWRKEEISKHLGPLCSCQLGDWSRYNLPRYYFCLYYISTCTYIYIQYLYTVCALYIYIVYHIFIIHDHIFIKLDKILQFGGRFVKLRHTPLGRLSVNCCCQRFWLRNDMPSGNKEISW